jgi:hypothetical protein
MALARTIYVGQHPLYEDLMEGYVNKNPPDVAGKPGGFFTDYRDRMVILDALSAGYIKSVAEVAHKTPSHRTRLPRESQTMSTGTQSVPVAKFEKTV